MELRAPTLPVELLAGPWPHARAYELVRALYRAICAAAEQAEADFFRAGGPE